MLLLPLIIGLVTFCFYLLFVFPFVVIKIVAKSIKEEISFRWSCRNDSIPLWYPVKEDYETYRIRNGLPEWPSRLDATQNAEK